MLMADTPRTVSLRAGLLLRLGIVLVLLLALDAVAVLISRRCTSRTSSTIGGSSIRRARWRRPCAPSTGSCTSTCRTLPLEIFQFDEVDKNLLQSLVRARGFHRR